MVSRKLDCLLEAEYIAALSQLVDFSLKLINTNIKGGIRIADSQVRELPYVCLQSIRVDNSEIWRDYCQNGGTEAKPYKHFRAHRHENIDDEIASIQKDIALISKNAEELKANKDQIKSKKDQLTRLEQIADLQRSTSQILPKLLKQTAHYQEIGIDKLNVRLPQLLVHQGDDDYLAITPLQSAGLAEYFYQTAQNTGLHRAGRYSRLQRSIGGTNSQNAGGLVRYLTSPIRVSAPFEKGELRKALTFAFKGLSMNISLNELKVFIEYRAHLIEKNSDSQQSDQYRKWHFKHFLKVVEHYLKRLSFARNQVQNHAEYMPAFDTEWQSLQEVSKAYCLAQQLNEPLCRDMARYIVLEVMQKARANELSLALREDEQRQLASALKEVIYE